MQGINLSRLLDFSDPVDSFEVITRVVTMIVMVCAFKGTLKREKERDCCSAEVASPHHLPSSCMLIKLLMYDHVAHDESSVCVVINYSE